MKKVGVHLRDARSDWHDNGDVSFCVSHDYPQRCRFRPGPGLGAAENGQFGDARSGQVVGRTKGFALDFAAPYCHGRQFGQGACYQNMSADPKPGQDEVNGIAGDDKSPAAGKTPVELALEIAYLLLIDVVGYSRLLVNEQIEQLQELNRIVRSTDCFRVAEKSGKLVRVPTGDGMALLFFRSPEEPVRCALEIQRALKEHPDIQLRMGIHGGPVNQITDVNDQVNVAGSGINTGQRVLDCGDAGHILLSKHLADDLAQYRHWQPYLHDLGECEVKHGVRLHIVNLYKEGLGNPALPEKLKRRKRWKQAISVRPIAHPVGRNPCY